jgi:hypothetical protein
MSGHLVNSVLQWEMRLVRWLECVDPFSLIDDADA